jgi:hypothetical protein
MPGSLLLLLQAVAIPPLPKGQEHGFSSEHDLKSALLLETAYRYLSRALPPGWQLAPAAQEIGQRRSLIAIPPASEPMRTVMLAGALQLALSPTQAAAAAAHAARGGCNGWGSCCGGAAAGGAGCGWQRHRTFW